MLIGQKIVIWFLTLILAPTLMIGGMFFFGLQDFIEERIKSDLEYVADVQTSKIDAVIKQNDTALKAYRTRLLLPDTLARYQKTGNPDYLKDIKRALDAAITDNSNYTELSVVGPDDHVLVSSNDAVVGKNYKKKIEADKGKNYGASVSDNVYRDEGGQLAVHLTGPIIYKGKQIGTIALTNKLSDLQEIVSDYSMLGQTGETLLAKKTPDGGAIFITNTRQDPDASMKRKIKKGTDSPILHASEGETLIRTNSISYAGQEIVSVSRTIDDTDWGLTVQIARTEAFEGLYTFTTIWATLMFIILVVGVLIAQYASRVITDPLIILATAVGRMSEGDLTTRIDLNANKIPERNEYGVLAKAFNNMAKNLESLDNMKAEFIMLTSHQLRTPASSVKGFLALLKDGYVKPNTKEFQELLESAYKENEQQLYLVNQILAVSQLESDKVKLTKTKVDVVNLTENILAQLRAIFIEHNQTVTLEVPKKQHKLVGDAEKIHMILENIIANASKYSPDNTEINISVKYTRTDAVIQVTDQGCGIEPGDVDQIFKKFSRLNTRRANNGQSSGLGLYLAKMLTDLHHGSIEVTSPGVGKGSTFTITLPFKQ